jgi:hypothetical protein
MGLAVAPAQRPARLVQMNRARFHVDDWTAHAPGRQRREDWLAWAQGKPLEPVSEQPTKEVLPGLLRRRVSAIGQLALRAASSLGKGRGARFIFCSRHGEFRRTKALLATLCRNEPPSPADFSLSVHNALAGLLSIAWCNGAGHTAIAAGRESFAFGLLEAAVCLLTRPEEAILLVYFDEPLLEEYAAFGEDDDASLALALLLAPARGSGDDVVLSFEPKNRGEPGRPSAALALDFLRFMLSGGSEGASPGDTLRWRWRRGTA